MSTFQQHMNTICMYSKYYHNVNICTYVLFYTNLNHMHKLKHYFPLSSR